MGYESHKSVKIVPKRAKFLVLTSTIALESPFLGRGADLVVCMQGLRPRVSYLSVYLEKIIMREK